MRAQRAIQKCLSAATFVRRHALLNRNAISDSFAIPIKFGGPTRNAFSYHARYPKAPEESPSDVKRLRWRSVEASKLYCEATFDNSGNSVYRLKLQPASWHRIANERPSVMSAQWPDTIPGARVQEGLGPNWRKQATYRVASRFRQFSAAHLQS